MKISNDKWIAVICFIMMCTLFGGIMIYQNKQPETYDIVVLGDSLMGNSWDDNGVTDVIASQLHKSVLKGAFGGSRATSYQSDYQATNINNSWSLYELSKSIVSKDFAVQKAALSYGMRYEYTCGQVLDYFPEYMEKLIHTDFNKVNILILAFGVNDYYSGIDIDTFAGSLRNSIEAFQTAYPQLKIIMLTPVWTCITSNGQQYPCDETDYGGGLLEDYVECELAIAKEYGISMIDNYHNSGINEETSSQYLEDGLHLSTEGKALIGNIIADFILNGDE